MGGGEGYGQGTHPLLLLGRAQHKRGFRIHNAKAGGSTCLAMARAVPWSSAQAATLDKVEGKRETHTTYPLSAFSRICW